MVEGLEDVGASLIADGEAAEPAEPSQGAFDDPAMAPQTLAAVDAASGDPIANASPAQVPMTARHIISLISVELVGLLARPAAALAHRRYGIDQLVKEAAVVDVFRGDPQGERDALGVGNNVAFAPGPATIGRIGFSLLAPLIWALKSSVTSSPDALSRCKRVVDRSWICPRLSPLALMRSTAPHHLISGRDRVPDQHPACTGTGSEAGGTSLLSGMVEPGGGMRSRAHLGHPRAAGLCADDRAIRSGPHCSLGRHEAGLYVSPDRDQQLTSEGDDGDTLDAPGGGADAVAIPARQRASALSG